MSKGNVEKRGKNNPLKKYTIREFSKTWTQKQVIPNSKTERTPDKYRNFLINWFYPKFGNWYVYDITTEEMVDYINWLRVQKSKYSRKENKQLSFYTVLKYKNILHAMFETAKNWDIISKNPCNFKIINTDFSDRRLNYFRYSEYNNFRRIRFHDLRHTHASILLYKGVDVKTISERLDHSDILTTLNIYTHIIAEQNQRVSEILDDL